MTACVGAAGLGDVCNVCACCGSEDRNRGGRGRKAEEAAMLWLLEGVCVAEL